MDARADDALLFVVPSLGKAAAQDEGVVQLLLFAAARLEQDSFRDCRAVMLSVGRDVTGWRELSAFFDADALSRISVAQIPEPAVSGQAVGNHKAAYDLFEFIKTVSFREVHCLDRGGIAYYATLARRLGLYFLDVPLVLHVVGGTIFEREVESRFLDDVSLLADDLLERGGLERADTVIVHDRRAWDWYSDKLDPWGNVEVYDLAGADPMPAGPKPADADLDHHPVVRIAFYGPLGVDGGLPLFCDTIDRALLQLPRIGEILFVGPPRAIGGMDAVSYIHVRAEKWGVPLTIRRDLSIADEIALLARSADVVVCDTRRRDTLRARLLMTLGIPRLDMGEPQDDRVTEASLASDNPGRIAGALVELASSGRTGGADARSLLRLWSDAITELPSLDVPLQEPLRGSITEPRVSVCVTHFRRPEKLRAALGSLAAQTYGNFEVIVVDDGSPEPEIRRELDEIRRQFEPQGWRVLVQENQYLGAARNHAAKNASGEYLLFMDDDNVAKPHELSTLVAAALRTDADIVTSFFDGFETEEDIARLLPSVRFPPFGALDPALGVFTNCFGDANALYRREAFEKIGGFTEDYGITHEDWELFCRAALEGLRMVCVPEPLFWYRIDPEGMFRELRKQLHETSNRQRHIRPYLDLLPYHQAKIVQLAQGLTTNLPQTTVDERTRVGGPAKLRSSATQLPYARVAIVMRTKDRPLLLRRAIRSVLEQTFGDWVLVVVNDGGDSDAVELVVQGADELRGRVVTLHHPVSLGMQTASNAGIARCDSDFIVIHDDDDTWQPDFLARTVSYLDEHAWNPRIGAVVTHAQVVIEEFDEDDELVARDRFLFNGDLEALALTDLAVENRFPPISFLFRRAAFDTIGPFSEQAGPLGDWDFHLRLLAQFDIPVLRQPLANYHHRSNATTGAYGNSVHAHQALHRTKRADLVNQAVRARGKLAGADPVEQLLPLGELQYRLIGEQRQEFQRLHDYMWNVEQTVQRIAARVGAGSAEPGRNLVRNGDFRVWPGPKPTRRPADGAYEYTEICPGFFVSHDGSSHSYRVERLSWSEGHQLPLDKFYLHLENDGSTKGGTWFSLEFVVPSISSIAGRAICLSGVGRMKANHNWLAVGGRYELVGGREVTWAERATPLGEEFSPWSVMIACPAVESSQIQPGDRARVIIKLPHDQPFEFDLTNVQLELGGNATAFEYRPPALGRRRRLRKWLRALRKRVTLRRRS